ARLADLDHIATFGFRGEALASIAAMAELEIESAVDAGGMATALHLSPGRSPASTPAPRTRGTTVAVRELFQQVPARRARLRGPHAEAQRIQSVVRASALSHPDVQFTLTEDGYLMLQTSGGDLRAAVASIYGADAAAALQPLGPREAAGALIRG